MEKLGFIENQDGQDGMDDRTALSISGCDASEQAKIRERLQEIIDEAPSDATIRVILRQITNGYRGALKIVSSQGEFQSRFQADQVATCLEKLCDKVERQILIWRSRRDLKLPATS